MAGPLAVRATLDDSATARAIWDALPIEAVAQTWGDEVYFPVPVSLAEDEAQPVVGLGDLGYWPPGRAFCIFFGPTPASRGTECRPASPVNVFGRVEGDPKVFKAVRAGSGCVSSEWRPESPRPSRRRRGPRRAGGRADENWDAMKIFLDTASVTELKEATAMGLLDGATTNPSLVARRSGRFATWSRRSAGSWTGP